MPECNVMVVAVLGFLLIGIIDVGCVAFGIVELASGDAIFLNDGLGEVLTVLGTYFTIPYLFILITFIALSNRFTLLPFLKKDFGLLPLHVMLAVTFVLFMVQQAFTDKYLALLRGDELLGFIAWDVLTALMYGYFRLTSPYAGMMYTVMYMSKLAAQWNYNYLSENQQFFGPNGILAMLFMTIPIIQFPLYVAGSLDESEDDNDLLTTTFGGAGASGAANGKAGKKKSGSHLADAFTKRFNLFLAHLLHSLDIISLYRFSFIDEEEIGQSDVYTLCPTPFKNLLAVLICVAFCANNLSILHLFHQRKGYRDAEIPFLPKRLQEASRRVEDETAQNEVSGSREESENASYQRRIFLYFMVMAVLCDLPLLVSRLELWRKDYWKLDIFIAKNCKNIADVIILMMRVDRNKKDQQQQSGGVGISTGGMGGGGVHHPGPNASLL